MITGLIIYAVLVTICLVIALGGNNDLATEVRELRTKAVVDEQQREWAERRNGSGVGRVVPMRRWSE